MDMPDIKAILQKLSVLKNNISLLASIIIALIAILLFIPAKLLSGSLKKKIAQQSVMLGNNVKRQLPYAPSAKQPDEVSKREAGYKKDADDMAGLALQSTERELLAYDIFPSPNDTSAGIFKDFGRRFRKGVGDLLVSVNANDCPTDAELDDAVNDAKAGSTGGSGYSSPRPYSRASYRSPYSRPSLSAYSRSYGSRTVAVDKVTATIRNELCLRNAKSCSVYGNPTDVTGYTFWGEYQYGVKLETAVLDCWFYQLGYWMIEDVFATIRSMNSGSSSVLTSPVKRFVGISFILDPGSLGRSVFSSLRSQYSSGGYNRKRYVPRTKDTSKRPKYVAAEEEGLTQACTGRLTNEDIDVVHFNVKMIVSAKSILPFMKELCSVKRHRFKGFFNELPQALNFKHNQITVLESKFIAVDQGDPLHEKYRYGDDAIGELSLVCEYVFDKKAYDAVKPASLKVLAEDGAMGSGMSPGMSRMGLR